MAANCTSLFEFSYYCYFNLLIIVVFAQTVGKEELRYTNIHYIEFLKQTIFFYKLSHRTEVFLILLQSISYFLKFIFCLVLEFIF